MSLRVSPSKRHHTLIVKPATSALPYPTLPYSTFSPSRSPREPLRELPAVFTHMIHPTPLVLLFPFPSHHIRKNPNLTDCFFVLTGAPQHQRAVTSTALTSHPTPHNFLAPLHAYNDSRHDQALISKHEARPQASLTRLSTSMAQVRSFTTPHCHALEFQESERQGAARAMHAIAFTRVRALFLDVLITSHPPPVRFHEHFRFFLRYATSLPFNFFSCFPYLPPT